MKIVLNSYNQKLFLLYINKLVSDRSTTTHETPESSTILDDHFGHTIGKKFHPPPHGHPRP